MERFRSLVNLVTAIAITALIAIACDSGTQEPDAPAAEIPSAGNAPSAADSASGGMETPSGSEREGAIDASRFPTDLPEGATAAIPDNFPSDVPVYPGAQPAQGRGVELEGKPLAAVQLVTNDSPEDVYEFYRTNLESQGWTIESSEPAGAGTAINAVKGDSCRTSLLIQPAESGGADVFIVTEC